MDFFHPDPSIATTKIFPPNWYFKPWDLSKPQSYYMSILEITKFVKFNTLNYNKIIPNIHISHALSKISFILLIENNPFTKQSNF
jgi:hypothetical protein